MIEITNIRMSKRSGWGGDEKQIPKFYLQKMVIVELESILKDMKIKADIKLK